MKLVGVAACTAGIAHTYISKEKIMNAAKNKGHEITIETQGTIGIENELKSEEIQNADFVIIMADVSIRGKERFNGKKIIEISTDIAIQSPNKIIELLEKEYDNAIRRS